MDDHQAFRNAVRGAPFDIAPRLVFADWLDERGDSVRAAAIRAHATGQCAAEEQGLVAAISADPDDNGPRRAFVAWLDERADFARGDEVRNIVAWIASGGRGARGPLMRRF